MQTKITREWAKENNIDFDILVEEFDEDIYNKHYSGQLFYRKSIIDINTRSFPDIPKDLCGI